MPQYYLCNLMNIIDFGQDGDKIQLNETMLSTTYL